MHSRYWLERGFPEESVVFFKAAQMVAEGLLMRGPNAEAEYHLRETHTNISTAAAETNKPQLCLEHSLKYLEFALNKTSFTGDLVVDFELGLTYNEAGVAQSMNGQFRAALESFRKCAEIWQSLDYYDETMMGLPFGNIGLVHWIEGRYTEALDTLHEMRRIYSRNYGVDDIKTFKYVLSAKAKLFANLIGPQQDWEGALCPGKCVSQCRRSHTCVRISWPSA